MRIMKLIVGLGNPGEKYSGNRHNIGFMAVDELARGYSFAPWKKRFQGYTAEGQIGSEKCILLKPSTYMNESGRAVGEAMRFYKLPLGDVIVIHDEIDLKPGVIRVKKGGGNAGHNGLKSISAHAGNEYVRVRLGIDHPGDRALVANYVLQDFAKSDRQWLVTVLEGIARGMAKLVEGGEAAFLGEAARGRKPATPAAKLNHEAAPLPNGKDHASSAEVLAARASVPAAQHRSGQHVEEAISEQTLVPQVNEPVVDGALAAAAADEAELFRAQVSEPPLFESAPEDRAKEEDADAKRGPRRVSEPRREETSALSAASRKGEGNLFMRWFRNRVRGGTL